MLSLLFFCCLFKQKTAYEMRISDWSSDVCSSDLIYSDRGEMLGLAAEGLAAGLGIDMGTAPPYRPDWKPMVESRFGILNDLTGIRWQIGSASCRERGCKYVKISVVDVSLKKNKCSNN